MPVGRIGRRLAASSLRTNPNRVLGGGYVQIDETPIRHLFPGNGQNKQGYLWTTHRPEETLCTAGKPLAPPVVWRTLFPSTSPERSNVMVMPDMGLARTEAITLVGETGPMSFHIRLDCSDERLQEWSLPHQGILGRSFSTGYHFHRSNG
jgi:hypothetical protein